MRRVIRRPALVVLALLVASSRVRAGEGVAAKGAPPEENSSYVPDDHEDVRRDDAAARAALEAHDVVGAARALQRVAGGPADAVIATDEPGVFEGAARSAHLRVVAGGAALLDAYEHEFGATAAAALERAVAARDETALGRVVEQFRPAEAGRRAALLLADLSIERADADAALGHLEGLEDLEEACANDLAPRAASWRAARLGRLATTLARDEASAARIAARLVSAPDAPPARADRTPPPEVRDWPTAGGDASRAAVPPPLGDRLAFVALESFFRSRVPSPFYDEEANPAPRPSLWIPTRGAVSNGRIFTSDGRALRVFDAASGRLALLPYALTPGADPSLAPEMAGRPSRRRFGWIEGHGLTVDGERVFVTRAGEIPRRGAEAETDDAGAPLASAAARDRVLGLRLVGDTFVRRFEVGGGIDTPGLPKGMRLFGTPLLYRGALHVAGLRPTPATTDRVEAWHVALDPETGAVRGTTFLGAGGPLRRGRDDEAMPASCAGARGRVVLVTSLGIAAAVDAVSGRTVWTLRYDRGRPDGDDLTHRLDGPVESGDRRSSFSNEPPLLADGRCFLAPTDSRYVLATADRPRGRARTLRLWKRHRVDDFRNLAVEQLVGVLSEARTDAPALVVVGQGYEHDGSPHTAVVALDPATGAMRWERALPSGEEPEPYGRALLTEGEVYVPTRDGIARYRVADGSELPPLDRAAISDEDRAYLSESDRPVGNLVPIPGQGLVAVDVDAVTIWRRP